MIPRFKFFIKTPKLIRFLIKLISSRYSERGSVKKFEEYLQNYFGVTHAICTSSYRVGLFNVLESLDLPKGSQVLLPPITIPDAVNVIRVLGLEPVFLEMDADDHNLCLNDLSEIISRESKVVISTSLSGIGSKVAKIKKICDENGLILIEDFSQCFGGRENDRLIGTIGHFGIASLSRGKSVCSMAGGIILSNKTDEMERVEYQIKDYTAPAKGLFAYYTTYNIFLNLVTSRIFFSCFVYWVLLFMNLFIKDKWKNIATEVQTQKDVFYDNIPIKRDRLPREFFTYFCNWQAQMAIEMMSDIDKRNEKRRDLGFFLLEQLSSEAKGFVPKSVINKNNNTYYHFPIQLTSEVQRDHFLSYLLKKGVDSTGYGLNLCNEETVFKDHHRLLEVANEIKYESAFLPTHEDYSYEDMKKIANAVNSYFSEITNI